MASFDNELIQGQIATGILVLKTDGILVDVNDQYFTPNQPEYLYSNPLNTHNFERWLIDFKSKHQNNVIKETRSI